jgi:hypothetical protein
MHLLFIYCVWNRCAHWHMRMTIWVWEDKTCVKLWVDKKHLYSRLTRSYQRSITQLHEWKVNSQRTRESKTKFVPCQQFFGLLIGRLLLARFLTRGAVLGANPNAGGSTILSVREKETSELRFYGGALWIRLEVGNPLNTRDTPAARRLALSLRGFVYRPAVVNKTHTGK